MAAVMKRALVAFEHNSLSTGLRWLSVVSDPVKKPGMGSGPFRIGSDAIHRLETPTPAFLKSKTVNIIGAPMNHGQPYSNTVDDGPQHLRDCGMKESFQKLGWTVEDSGDLDVDNTLLREYEGDGNCRHAELVCGFNQKLASVVASVAGEGKFPLILGGDHSIGIGVLAGLLQARPDVGVLWIDAHADINTPETSPSGNMHGMPLALLMGLSDPKNIPGCEWLADMPKLKPEQLVYVGLRDVDKGERDYIRDLEIPAFTMSHVDQYGIGEVMRSALSHLEGRPLHVSYDIDSCDPAIAPATGTCVRGGLTFREAAYVAEAIAATGRLGSADIVEVSPGHDGTTELSHTSTPEGPVGKETVDLGFSLLGSLLGNRIM